MSAGEAFRGGEEDGEADGEAEDTRKSGEKCLSLVSQLLCFYLFSEAIMLCF